MENKLIEILELASMGSPNNFETKEELLDCLKQNGGLHFSEFNIFNKGLIFITNKHGILQGIGFDSMGNFKIWNNTKFGIFKIPNDK